MKYYKVEAKCGHVRMNHFIKKNFYTCANNKKDAAASVRMAPRVKHHQKDAILNIIEITFDEYIKGVREHKEDKYFQVHNSSDQRLICSDIYLEIESEEERNHYKKNFNHSKQKLIERIIAKEWSMERRFICE